nr:cysteine-rich receptor-like protein kinase 10 [Ipomoea batatas]
MVYLFIRKRKNPDTHHYSIISSWTGSSVGDREKLVRVISSTFMIQVEYVLSVMDFQKWIVVFLILSLHVCATAAEDIDINYEWHSCGTNGTYSRDSAYQKNLDNLLPSLSNNVNEYGFYNGSVGQGSDRVSAIVLCRGDADINLCRDCVSDNARRILEWCPTQKEAFRWYNICSIYYSDESILGSLRTTPEITQFSSISLKNPAQFNGNLTVMVDRLRTQAAGGGPFLKYAADITSGPDQQTIFSYVQCTPDLSVRDCTDCINTAIDLWNKSEGNGRIGARVLRPSCFFRYEISSFFGCSEDPAVSEMKIWMRSRSEYIGLGIIVAGKRGRDQDFCLGTKTSPRSGTSVGMVAAMAIFQEKNGKGGGVRVKAARPGRRRVVGEMGRRSLRSDLLGCGGWRFPEMDYCCFPNLEFAWSSDGNKTVIIIVIVVAIAAGLIGVAICIFVILRKRQKRKANSPVKSLEETSSTVEISTVESLKYDLVTIQNATDNFSEANKLGEGGFGPVYKAWTHWKGGSASNVMDPMLRGTSSPGHEITKCIHIALLCVQENVADRPTMTEVLQMLSNLTMSLPVPLAPGFFIHSSVSLEASSHSTQNEMSINLIFWGVVMEDFQKWIIVVFLIFSLHVCAMAADDYNRDFEWHECGENIDKVKKPESRDSGSLVDIEPVSRRDTDDVDEVQENGQNGDPVPDYQGDIVDADGHVDDVVHEEQEVPSQVSVDLPRRSDRERRPSTRYSSSQYVLLTDGGEPESYEEAMENKLNNYGFYNDSIGKDSDRASAIALCRGDADINLCRGCVNDTARRIIGWCPTQKEAFAWYNICSIYYSDKSIIGGSWETTPVKEQNSNTTHDNAVEFNEDLTGLVNGLIGRAANGDQFLKYAADSTPGPDSQTIYAYMQCSPDLSVQDCTDCLNNATAEWNSSEGPDGNNKTVIIVVCIVAGLIGIAICIFIIYRKLQKRKANSYVKTLEETSSTDEISVVESLKYDLITLQNATNNFSEGNKLGEGGFGPVYKGQLQNGLEVAVKRLSENSRQGNLEFKNEVALMARLQHRNLAWTHWKGGSASNVIDPILRGTLSPVHEITKCIHIALLCVQENVTDRPTMGEVLQMLSNLTMSLPIPIAPGFFIHSNINSDASNQSTRNEMSISEQFPSVLLILILDFMDSLKWIAFQILRKMKGRKPKRYENSDSEEISFSEESVEYDFITIQNATNNFSKTNKIGEGGFGVVYKGTFENGQQVAVKRLSKNLKGGSQEFKNEVALMVKFQHRNLVKLLGFSLEGKEVFLAWTHWKDGSTSNVIDSMLKGISCPVHEITKCIHIALLCVQESVADRPKMIEVLHMLNNLSIRLPEPLDPGLFIRGSIISSEASSQFTKNVKSISDQYHSSTGVADNCADFYPAGVIAATTGELHHAATAIAPHHWSSPAIITTTKAANPPRFAHRRNYHRLNLGFFTADATTAKTADFTTTTPSHTAPPQPPSLPPATSSPFPRAI